jgi:hypothetical protein
VQNGSIVSVDGDLGAEVGGLSDDVHHAIFVRQYFFNLQMCFIVFWYLLRLNLDFFFFFFWKSY